IRRQEVGPAVHPAFLRGKDVGSSRLAPPCGHRGPNPCMGRGHRETRRRLHRHLLDRAWVLSLSVMIEIYPVFYKHRTAGLRDILSLLNLNRPDPKVDTTQQLYQGDTLDVKVKRGVEEFAGKIS